MMRHLFLYLALTLLSLTIQVGGQVVATEPEKEMKNEQVEEAFRIAKEGDRDESLKQLLKIISSGSPLSLKDSIRVNRHLAGHLKNIGDYNNAVEYAKRYIQLQAKLNANGSMNYFYMMHFFNAAEQYDSSIHYMKLGIEHLLSAPKLNKHFLITNYNNIGYTYYLNKQLDSAEVYYKRVINFEKAQEDYAHIYGLATGNLGQLYFDKGDYKKSLAMFEIDAALTKGRIPESHNNAMVGQAECYFNFGNYSTSKRILSKLIGDNIPKEKTRLRAFRLMGEVCTELNNPACAALYLDKFIQLNDEIIERQKSKKELTQELSRTKVDLIEKDLALAKNKVDLINNELLLTKSREKSQKLKTRIFIISLILSFLVLIMVFSYYRTRQKKNQAITQLRNELLENEINDKKKDLSNVVTNLTYKRKFIDEVQEKLKNIQQQPNEMLMENLALLIREFNNYRGADKNVAVLQADIDKVNLSFFNRLAEKFPLLTENEKEICGLFVLNLSSKDIAIIRNVGPEAVKKARHRIRKKLPITTEENLTTFLNSV